MLSEPSHYGLMLTTTSSHEEAKALAQRLLENHLAACVNYFRVDSLYRWQGSLQQDAEWQLIIKTDLRLQNAIEEIIIQHHSYELPELIIIPIVGGSSAYLGWLGQQVTSADPNLEI